MGSDSEQMSFDLFPDSSDDGTTSEPEFDSEEQALETLISKPTDDDAAWEACDPENPVDCTASDWLRNGVLPPDVFSSSLPDSTGGDVSFPSSNINEAESAVPAADGNDGEDTSVSVPSGKSARKHAFPSLNATTLRRAALAFLASREHDSLGCKVATSIPHLVFDAASARFSPNRTGKIDVLTVSASLVCTDPKQILASEELLRKLEEKLAVELARRNNLEEKIRATEPALNDLLFPDDCHWDYASSRDRRYHACVKRIAKIRAQIAHADLPHRIEAAGIVDTCFLVIPYSLPCDLPLPDSWGIVAIERDFSASVLREPQTMVCTAEARENTAFHIAESSAREILFANGIAVSPHEVRFFPPPKRRRSYLTRESRD